VALGRPGNKKKRVGGGAKTISQVGLGSQNIFLWQAVKKLTGADGNIRIPGWGER